MNPSPATRRSCALQAGACALLFLLNAARAEPDRLVGLVPPLVAQKPLRIGVTLVHLNDEFWRGVAFGIVDEAKRSNVTVVRVSVAGAYGNTREQFAQLNTLKALGVDYVALGAASFDGYDPVIRDLRSAGVKVIAAAIPVNSASVSFGVTQDDTFIGKMLADAICSKDGSAKIIAIPGPAGAEWARLRYEGFIAETKHCEGVTVYSGAFRGSVDLQQGLSQTADMLQKHPDVNFVYTPQMSLGMGAVQAVRQSSRHAAVVSSAMVRATVPMIVDGRFLAVVSEPGIIMGRLIVQYAIRDAEAKPMVKMVQPARSPYPYVTVPATVITSSNARTFPLDVYEIAPADFKLDALQ
jgi:ABC-type sugar transport system substrate-binding protein